MGLSLRRASSLVFFLISLHFLHAATDLASVDQNHDNLPNQAIESKPNGDTYAGKTTESEVVIKKGGGGGGGRGGGGGGRSFGGGGRSFGGGGRSFGGGGGGRIRPIPIAGGGSYHGGRPSSSDRERPNGLLGLAALAGLFWFSRVLLV